MDEEMTMVILEAEDAAQLSAAAEALANDPYLTGVTDGLCGGMAGALTDARRDPPDAVSIPGRWATGSDGVRWSKQAQTYAQGVAAGWEVVQTPRSKADKGWAHGDDVIAFGSALARQGSLDDTAESAFHYLENPGRWAWEHGVWAVLRSPGPEDATWAMFCVILDLMEESM